MTGERILGDLSARMIESEPGVSLSEWALMAQMQSFGPSDTHFLEETGDKNWIKRVQTRVEEAERMIDEPWYRFEKCNDGEFSCLIPPVKDLLLKMARLTPNERITIHEALRHPFWLSPRLGKPDSPSEDWMV